MARPTKLVDRAKGEIEDQLARVSRIDGNQRRIALRTHDDYILDEVEDTRQAAREIKTWLLEQYPDNDPRKQWE